MEETIIQWILEAAVRIALAWGVVLLGRWLARQLRIVVQRLVSQPHVMEVVGPTIGRLFCDIAYWGLLGLSFGLALIVLGVPATVVLTVSSIVFILAAVALQQSLSNLAATVIFLAFQPFRRGEDIETMGKAGTVQEIQLFNTVLHTYDQRLVSLPNSEIQASGVLNLTRTGIVRNEVTLAVGYQANLERVRQVIQESIDQDPRILADPPPSIVVQELADYAVRLIVYTMTAPADGFAVRSDLRTQIKARFDAEQIPFALPKQEIQLVSDGEVIGH
jgi:small conductance mechanosensitive channel